MRRTTPATQTAGRVDTSDHVSRVHWPSNGRCQWRNDPSMNISVVGWRCVTDTPPNVFPLKASPSPGSVRFEMTALVRRASVCRLLSWCPLLIGRRRRVIFVFVFFSVRAKCPRATPSIDQFRRRHKDLCNKHYSTFWTLTSLITANWVSIFRWHTSAALRQFSQLKSRVTEPICGPTLRRIESDPKEVDESVKRAIEWCVITWNLLKMKRVSVEWSRREFDWFEWMKLCCCVYAQWNWHRFPILRTRAGFAHVSVRHTAEDGGR